MAQRPLDWTFVFDRVRGMLLPVWFAVFACLTATNLYTRGFLFIDIAVYRDAALAVVAGADPWATSGSTGIYFAAPPPTLLFALPLAFVSPEVAVIGSTAVLLSCAVWAVRTLRLPYWWLLFPPIFECLLVGNLDVLVLALLLVPGPVAGVAAVAKVYGAVPLLLQRRWSALLVAALLSVLTLPLWADFLASLGVIAARLDLQSQGFSAWGTWWLLPTAAALWVLRRRGAEWLVVPGVWPDTQTHYAAMSLPVVHRYPVAAAIIGLASPLAPVVAIIVMAVQVRFGWGAAEGDADR